MKGREVVVDGGQVIEMKEGDEGSVGGWVRIVLGFVKRKVCIIRGKLITTYLEIKERRVSEQASERVYVSV